MTKTPAGCANSDPRLENDGSNMGWIASWEVQTPFHKIADNRRRRVSKHMGLEAAVRFAKKWNLQLPVIKERPKGANSAV